MPSTDFNWIDQSGNSMGKEINVSDKANKDTIPYLKTKISNLNIRLAKSKDAIEKADLADEISKCQQRIEEIEAGTKKLRAKPVADAPSIADKNHFNNITTRNEVKRGQIVGSNNMFVSIL